VKYGRAVFPLGTLALLGILALEDASEILLQSRQSGCFFGGKSLMR
jgi:hypothetical protein